MDSDVFEQLEQQLRSGGSEAGFSFLIEKFRAEKRYPLLFEARLMKKRHELGVSLIQTERVDELPPEARQVYERATVEAAREAGLLYLADGDIERAWPYLRAVGETKAVAEAIRHWKPKDEQDNTDAVISIAFYEQVDPRRGFELLLERHGICRAITAIGQYPVPDGREESALLLIRTLHGELVERLQSTIEQAEGEKRPTQSIPELIEGRDWLFEGNTYYIDSSHVASVVQQSIHLTTPKALRLGLELTEYGKRLSSMYQYKGDPPFENVYEDHGVYLRALLGQDVEAAVAHFKKKIAESDPAQVGTAPAEALVTLLCRLERYADALSLFREHLTSADPAYLRCPTALQLCQSAGDFTTLKQIAKERGDVLSFAAATLQA